MNEHDEAAVLRGPIAAGGLQAMDGYAGQDRRWPHENTD